VLDLSTVTAMTLLATYGSPADVAAHIEEARKLMRRSGTGGLSQDRIGAVIEAARQTLGVPCIEAERHLLCTLAQDLLDNHRAAQGVEHTLARLLHPIARETRRTHGRWRSRSGAP